MTATPMPRAANPAALRVLARTAQAWRVSPDSPRAIARRAPHGHVPVRATARMLRRLPRFAASAALTLVAGRDGFAPPMQGGTPP